MILNIDTRVFDFILPKGKLIPPSSNFVWFYKDHIRISDLKSLLIVPCENKALKNRHIGLSFKTLKKRIAHTGKNNKVEIEIFLKDDDYDGFRLKSLNPTLLYSSCEQEAFCVFGENYIFKCKLATSTLSFRIATENEVFKNKIDLYSSIFRELFFSGDNVLKIENGILFLRLNNKFNGLDRNKGFTLYYNELGEDRSIYKAVQEDITLYEMGRNGDE